MFYSLTGDGRVWIYVAQRALDQSEIEQISNRLEVFCDEWQAHGKDLTASYEIHYSQIFLLAVNEHNEAASGCSIDTATAVFKEIDSKYNLDLFNRFRLCFILNNQLFTAQLNEINELYQQNKITRETAFLNNTISTLSALKTSWEIPFKDSWAFKKVKEIA